MATPSNPRRELLELENKFWTALRDRDLEAALALTDFPCILSGPQGVSSVDRASFTKMMQGASYSLDAFSLEHAEVRLVGSDVAIVAYKAKEDVTVNGEQVHLDVADASTWVRRDGAWRCVQHAEAIVGDPFGRDRTH